MILKVIQNQKHSQLTIKVFTLSITVMFIIVKITCLLDSF